jgi:Protein tyrosine and serine/threonine kinase
MQSSPASTSSPTPSYSRNALLSIQRASITAREFDSTYNLRNVDRELSIPLFRGSEVVLESTTPYRVSSNGFYNEFALQSLRVTRELVDASSSDAISNYRRKERVADRLLEQPGAYSVKYCAKGLVDTEHGPQAASELVLETKILMNLSPSHPNLLQAFAANGDGIDAFLESGRKGFFLLVDRLSTTLDQKIEGWRRRQITKANQKDTEATTEAASHSTLTDRLEVANDICSALVFLASRELVYYLRPTKVGFDARSGRLKLCEFGEARQEGLECPSLSIVNAASRAVFTYTAPEVLSRHPTPATVSSDVYAFGILLWELAALQRPFDGFSKVEHFKRVVEQQERPAIRPNAAWPRDITKLMEQCWDPNFRPTIKSVQDVLETILLFNDDSGDKVPAKPKSSTSATSDSCGNKAQDATSVSPAARSRRTSNHGSSVEQHLRRSTKDGHSPRSSGASVATQSTFRTKGDYSAFTNGNASPRHNQVQKQRISRQRSMSRGPASVRGERGSDGVADETRIVSASCKDSNAETNTPRPRRLSMEIPRTKVTPTSVPRSRSMTGEEAAVLRKAADRPIPMEIDDSDESSKLTTPTLPCSESSPEPALVSPQRKPRASRRSSHQVSPASSEEFSSSVSPNARAHGSRVPVRNDHLPRRVSRTQSLRRLVQGEGFPTADCVPLQNETDQASRVMHSSPRRSSMGDMKLSSFSAGAILPNLAFSLDNIPQVPSPVAAPAPRVSTRRSSFAAQPSTPQFAGVSRYRSNDSLQSMQASSKCPRLVSDPRQVSAAATFAAESQVSATPSPRRRTVQRSSSSRDMPMMLNSRSPRRASFISEAGGAGRAPLVRSDSSTFRVSPTANRRGAPSPNSRDVDDSCDRSAVNRTELQAHRRSAPSRRPSYSAGSLADSRVAPPAKRESFSAKLRAEMAEERLLQQQHRSKGPAVARRSSKLASNDK